MTMDNKQEIDASMSFCIPYKTTLRLDEEEIVKRDIYLCGENTSQIPYGKVGRVDRGTCCCFNYLESDFGPISPGCGCDKTLVDKIVHQLQPRMHHLGEQAQIEKSEQAIHRLDEINGKLDIICEYFQIPRNLQMKERND